MSIHDRYQLQFLSLILLFFLSACSPLANLIVGYHEPKVLKSNEIEKLAKQIKIETFPIYSLDTNYYTFIQTSIQDQNTKSKFLQPIVILYFENDTIASFNNNCFFPGLPNTQWNEFGTFNEYPPKSGCYSEHLKKFKGSEFIKLLEPINYKAKIAELVSANKLLIVCFNKTFKRQTKNLAKLIQSKYKESSQHIVFINNDNYLVKLSNIPSTSACQP